MTYEDDSQANDLAEEDLVDDAEVDTMVRESIHQVLGDAHFTHSKIDHWVANIIEGCLKRLAAFAKPFKYIVTCNLQQKAGAGLHSSCCTRWCDKVDGKLTVQWEGHDIFLLVTVFWLAI